MAVTVNENAIAAGALELPKIFYVTGEVYHDQQFIYLRGKITWKLH
jgi:hypothetical protein